MSHLAKNGLNYYAPILVKTMTRMAGKVGPGVNVIPLLTVPVGGISSETLVRDLVDLDSWIVSTGAGQAAGLPDSRDTFRRVILDAEREVGRVYNSSAPLSLPGRTKNPRIRPFMSQTFAGTIQPPTGNGIRKRNHENTTVRAERKVMCQPGSKPLP
jgi:hypothetical protein